MEAKILQSKKIGNGKNDKNKKQMILLGVLVLFFLYLIYSTFFGNKKNTAKPKDVAKVDVVLPVSPVPAEAEKGINQEEENADWGNSPFSIEPAEPETASSPLAPRLKLQLQGVMVDKVNGSYAIINEKIVKKGDRIADNTVIEITQGQVILQSDDGHREILRS